MPRFQFPKSIQSRPVYGTLTARAGTSHLMLADAEGADALVDLAASATELMARAHVIYIPKATGATYTERLRALKLAQLYVGPSLDAALPRLRKALADAHMGLQIYLAATEGLIGQAMQEAIAAGYPASAIQTEHRGSVARRVQCVHCKGITEDVETTPFVCSHCGLNLFVRDHYSRRLAAFQGVRVDAEDPGEVPVSEGLYQ